MSAPVEPLPDAHHTLYLYAIVDHAPDLADMKDQFPGPVFLIVDTNDTTIIGCEIDRVPELSRQALAAQDHLVRALDARVPALLPMRFGSTARDYQSLWRVLEERRAILRDQLDLVRDREQMTMRVLGERAAAAIAPRAASGREYLRRRAAGQHPAEVDPLLAAAQSLSRATSIEPGRHHGVVATVYQLIDRGRADEYRAAVEAAAAAHPQLKVHISGPSPAYAFATL